MWLPLLSPENSTVNSKWFSCKSALPGIFQFQVYTSLAAGCTSLYCPEITKDLLPCWVSNSYRILPPTFTSFSTCTSLLLSGCHHCCSLSSFIHASYSSCALLLNCLLASTVCIELFI